MATTTDLVVLGGGTGGYVAAIRAAQKGMSVTLVEKEKVGGTCLHKGCIPTKALLRSAEVIDLMKEADEFGVAHDGSFRVDYKKVVNRKENIVNQLHQGVQGLLKKNKIRVLYGRGAILGPSIFSPQSGTVAVTFDEPDKEEEIIVPKKLIIATGSSPKTLPHLPLDEEYVLSSDGMLQLEKLPKSIAIVGGGIIGVEWASLLNSLGVEVTIIEFLDRLTAAESPAISKALQRSFKKKGIRVLLKKEVTGVEVKEEQVEMSIKGEPSLVTDKVMVAVGRKPNVTNIGLDNTSVTFDSAGIHVNQHYQTSENHIYAIGDCIDTPMLAHAAMKEGELAVQHMTEGTSEPLAYINVPRCTYTSPEIASVGYTQSTLPEGLDVSIGTFSFSANGKALIHGGAGGFVEVIKDNQTEDLLGVSIIGPHATDLISEASTAIYLDATPLEIGEAIHPHPTLSEAIQEAALDVYGQAIHK